MFKKALNGIRLAIQSERNIRIHILVGSGVIVGIFLLNGTIYHLILATTAIVLVLYAELVNTAIERLCDLVEPNHSNLVMSIKDISAGAVLLNVIFSLFTALIIWGTL